MAASASSADDGKKRIRKISLTYLKNSFHKKSQNSGSPETTSNDGDKIFEGSEILDHDADVTFSATRDPQRSFQRVDLNETSRDKSNGFFRNIKKRLRIRDLKLCKSQQKIKAMEPSSPAYGLNDDLDLTPSQLPLIFFNENKNGDISITSDCRNGENGYLNIAQNSSETDSIEEEEEEEEERAEEEPEYVSSNIGNVAEPQASSSRESGESSPDSQSGSEKKFNLTEELLKLSKYGWYWGPISRDEADSKLANEPDGAFLVRDSSADKYLLTLSFKSCGKLLHTRVEHSGGLFSLYYHPECERFSSVVALINHSMSFSQSAVYCYSRPRYPGHPAFPVRLTKPVSRFTQVRSLQYLCRFVIRQNTRVDNIGKLPLPETIRGYIKEAHY